MMRDATLEKPGLDGRASGQLSKSLVRIPALSEDTLQQLPAKINPIPFANLPGMQNTTCASDMRRIGNTRVPYVIQASPKAQVNCSSVHGLTIYRFDFSPGAHLQVRVGQLRYHMLFLTMEGVSKVLQRDTVDLIPTNQFQFRPVEHEFTVASKLGARGILLLVGSDLLTERLNSPGKRGRRAALPVQPITFQHSDLPPAALLLKNCMAGLATQIGEELFPQQAERTSELILMLLAETMKERLSTGEWPAQTSVPWYVTAVEKHLKDSMSESVSVSDLARAVGLSPRTLHEGFRRHRGCSPMKFLREQRMTLIRQELSDPDETTTVTDAALKWGFNHLGRFSSYYLGQFGEKPSETLRNARGRINRVA